MTYNVVSTETAKLVLRDSWTIAWVKDCEITSKGKAKRDLASLGTRDMRDDGAKVEFVTLRLECLDAPSGSGPPEASDSLWAVQRTSATRIGPASRLSGMSIVGPYDVATDATRAFVVVRNDDDEIGDLAWTDREVYFQSSTGTWKAWSMPRWSAYQTGIGLVDFRFTSSSGAYYVEFDLHDACDGICPGGTYDFWSQQRCRLVSGDPRDCATSLVDGYSTLLSTTAVFSSLDPKKEAFHLSQGDRVGLIERKRTGSVWAWRIAHARGSGWIPEERLLMPEDIGDTRYDPAPTTQLILTLQKPRWEKRRDEYACLDVAGVLQSQLPSGEGDSAAISADGALLLYNDSELYSAEGCALLWADHDSMSRQLAHDAALDRFMIWNGSGPLAGHVVLADSHRALLWDIGAFDSINESLMSLDGACGALGLGDHGFYGLDFAARQAEFHPMTDFIVISLDDKCRLKARDSSSGAVLFEGPIRKHSP